MILLQTEIPGQGAGELSDYVPIPGKAAILFYYSIYCVQVDRGRAGGHRLDVVRPELRAGQDAAAGGGVSH